MPALHIRDISDTLMKRLKSDAALNGITLREHVINQLGGQKTADRPVAGLRRAEELHVGKRSIARSERVPASGEPVDIDATSYKDTATGKVSLPVRRVSASLAGMPGACVCTHPRKDHFQGQACIQCPCPRFEETL